MGQSKGVLSLGACPQYDCRSLPVLTTSLACCNASAHAAADQTVDAARKAMASTFKKMHRVASCS